MGAEVARGRCLTADDISPRSPRLEVLRLALMSSETCQWWLLLGVVEREALEREEVDRLSRLSVLNAVLSAVAASFFEDP